MRCDLPPFVLPPDPLNVRMKCDGSVTSPAFITRKIERLLKQQSRRRYAANGFAFVPHTCRFLGQQSLGVELRVKGSNLHLVPILPLRERETPVRARKYTTRQGPSPLCSELSVCECARTVDKLTRLGRLFFDQQCPEGSL